MTQQSPLPLTSGSNDTADPEASTLEARDLARYIAELSGEMAILSRRAGWPLVAYFLDMAQTEAAGRLPQTPSPQSRSRRQARPR